MSLPRARIVGTGHFVPPRVVTNDDLAQLMDTSDEWIQQRTGIKTRRHVDKGMLPSDLGLEAAKQALDAAEMKAEDIDCVIAATLSSEHYFPGTAFFLQDKLGLSRQPAFDLRAQCSGFLYGLQMANAFIASGTYKKILLVGVEIHSQSIEYSNRGRDVTVLFGDGAGAAVLVPTDDPKQGVHSVHIHAQGEHAKRLWLPVPACGEHPCITHQDLEDGKQFPHMDGRYVFKNACMRLPEAVMEAMGTAELTLDEVDWFLFHQANLRINEFVGNMMGIPPEKAPFNIDKYGNCSAASIPMLLDECIRDGRIKQGQTIVMAAFGSGFTWGGAAVTL